MEKSWLIRKDLPSILRLDEDWTEEEYVEALRKRSMIAKVVRMVEGGPIVGYILYELVTRQFTVHRLAVDPLFRRLGVGSLMVGDLQRRLARSQRTLVDMWVPEGALDVQLFLRSLGFRAEDIDREHFGEDAGYRLVYRAPVEVEKEA